MEVPQYDETRSSLFNEILTAGRSRYPNEHPFQVAFLNGELSKEQLQTWSANRFYFHNAIPRKDCAVLTALLTDAPDDKDGIMMWGQKVAEEQGNEEEESHPSMFLRWCEGLGMTKEQVFNTEVFPPIKIAVDAYADAARLYPFTWGVGASISEFTVPYKMKRMIAAIEKHYNWVPKDALDFWTGHMEADEIHGNIMIDLVEKHGKDEKAKTMLRDGYFFKLDLHRIILDTCHYELILKK